MAQDDDMKRPSITIPQWMIDEIEERREKSVSRSEYIRDALEDRFDQEDNGTWDLDPKHPDVEEQPAD